MRAFSLVELSIVLVILGLLTGGILAGQSLIRAAELRSVTSDFSRYQTAVQSFKDKYMQLPGDMNNATRFWSRHSSDAWCVTNSSAAVATSGTCDGNGGGTVGYWAPAASQSSEGFQFWRHLALAGLIEGNYTGLAGASGAAHAVLNENAPASKISNGAWSAESLPNAPGNSITYAIDYQGYLAIGATRSNSSAIGPLIRPEEAWGIDTKIDDGKPAQGNVIALYWNNLCAAADDGTHANNDLAASYRVQDSTIQCALFFRRAF